MHTRTHAHAHTYTHLQVLKRQATQHSPQYVWFLEHARGASHELLQVAPHCRGLFGWSHFIEQYTEDGKGGAGALEKLILMSWKFLDHLGIKWGYILVEPLHQAAHGEGHGQYKRI